MDSKQTGESQTKKQSVHDWLPDDGKGKGKNPTGEDKEQFIRKFLGNESVVEEPAVVGVDTANSTGNIDNTDTIGSMDTIQTVATENRKDTVKTESQEQSVQTVLKRTSSKQRKESLEEYRQAFLTVPKLEDRKPVFISREIYREDVEMWKKL